MKRLLINLSQLPRQQITLAAFALTIAVGLFDYATGFDLEVTPFYLIPIYWVSWAVGRRVGLSLAAFSAICFGIACVVSGRIYGHPVIPVWNALMILVLFFVVVFGITTLKAEIVEHILAEKAKLKAERLLEKQEKLAVLGTLTAGIAHEIRNPLTSLKARLYTLEKHLQTVPAAKRDTDIISAEISRLERIVQDALSFARPADPRLETMAVDRLLHEVRGLMASSLEGHGVQLVVEPCPKLFIRADSGHLKQVLINLVGNGADAIKGAGSVTLRAGAERSELGGRETDVVAIEVTDTGHGIPPEIEARLFDPFFSTKETGTGLGLSIAASIIEKHGGKIEYQTGSGHGTTFRVVLPRENADTVTRANGNENSAH